MGIRVEEYIRPDGTNPYQTWFDGLGEYVIDWGPGYQQGWETQEVIGMALTRDFRNTVVARVARDPAFAKALLDEAATLFLADEPETARLILRDLVNATLGFEQLAKLTDLPSKSLHRMLSSKGNPSMDNLAAIFGAVGSRLKVDLKVRTVKAA